MNRIRLISCITFAALFTSFAAVQYNDPDGFIWIIIYMIVALLSVAAIFKPLSKLLLVVLIAFYLGGSLYLFPERYQGVAMPMQDRVPAIELARESLGLLICAASLGWLLFLTSRKSASRI